MALAMGMVVATLLMMSLVGSASVRLFGLAGTRDTRELGEAIASGHAKLMSESPVSAVMTLPPRSDHAGDGSGRRTSAAVCVLLRDMRDVLDDAEWERCVSEGSDLATWEASCEAR